MCRTNRPRCHHCKAEHTASYKGCPAFKKEKEALKLKNQSKTTIHYARKIVEKQGIPEPYRQRSYSQATQSSQSTTSTAGETTYRNAVRHSVPVRPSSGARSRYSALPPIEGAQLGPRRRENQNRIRNIQEIESEDIENRRNSENSTKKQIKKNP